jgi:LPS sulfotransferase NodH
MSYDLVDAGADYPEWQGSPRRSLVICTQQRCGSTLLGEAVYFSGGLGCPLEYFHSGFRPGFAARWKADDLPAYVAALHRHRTDPSGTLAIKLFWRDVVHLLREYAPSEFTDLFWFTPAPMPQTIHRRILAIISGILPNPTFVLLGRRDQIGQAVSHHRAGEAGSWRKFAEGAAGGEPAHDFGLTFRILAAIQLHNAHWHDFFRANGACYHALDYEDLVQSYESTLARLFAAIGRSDARIPPPRLHKQADGHSERLARQFFADAREMTRR